MRYIAAEDVAKAKEMDLLTYLRNYEPQELVHVSGNTYCTREHDSLRISNGKWCWFSQGIGGRSALDYLIKVKGIPSCFSSSTIRPTPFTAADCPCMCILSWTSLPMEHSYKDDYIE